MVCRTIVLPDGTTGIVCGIRAPRCSTPGCGRKAELECDHAVQRKTPPKRPKRGDARVHREHRVIFYVWRVEGEQVNISIAQPGKHGTIQTVPIADWFAKTDATCDRPICSGCCVRVGRLEYCQAHGRAVTASRNQ